MAAVKTSSASPVRTARAARVTAVRGKAMPPARYVEPMKALGVTTVPTGKWWCEVKFDGYRALTVINRGEVELWSRNHKPLGPDYPEVVEALGQLHCVNAVIDGEIVALDETGRSRFQLLQGRGHGAQGQLAYYVFDLLHLNGVSLVNEPIERRRALLEKLFGKTKGVLRVSTAFSIDPKVLLAEAVKKGFEGIIAKTPGSLYEIGRRSGAWLKCKVTGEQEFVIGGYTPPQNSRPLIGALLVGYYAKGKLTYAGKVGSGFDGKMLAELHAKFKKLHIDAPAFTDLPRPKKPRFGRGMTASEMREVTWLKPELVAQVRFTEWTDDGSLRHPVFLGLRTDKSAKQVRREAGPSS
jgi:bifunctional non-homologous end joining protein LigD